ncbi:shikimate dehydrogenase [Falsihalocynthiibacter sp. SS001]|uniref:shikimate dehydrogenase n=1 Tax=Falsihalocynthiibacter sp. SS001 TaxID=3349698 RepID=UPI0036D382D6
MSEHKIPLAGVIGAPIAHSRSPLLHGHWLKKYGIAGYYVPLHIDRSNLEDAIRTLPTLGFVGVNVTIPYKEDVLEFADSVTDRASLIGAANTLTFRNDGKIHADNTDGYGFIENLRSGAPMWEPTIGPALVFGAGGAARAVIASLLEAGAPEILLTNRTKNRSEGLRSDFGQKVTVVDWVQAANALEDATTVVNTTSLGMKGGAEFKISLDRLQKGCVVNDLVYTPLRTKFLEQAEKSGCHTVDGLGMLLYQGAPGFERWFGVRPEVDEELRQAVLGA